MKAWQLIEKEENWGKADGVKFEGKHCPVTAMAEVYVEMDYVDALRRFRKVIKTLGITRWNDAPKRTHAEVLAAMKKADV